MIRTASAYRAAGSTILLAILLALPAGSGIPSAARGEPAVFQEYQVKAAFLFNFAKYVEWPPEAFPAPGSPVILVILGENPFGNALKSFKGKSVNGRPLVVRFAATPEEIDPCHILYVSASERPHLSQVLKAAEGRSLLTVGDMEGFARKGGIINMAVEGEKVAIEINQEASLHAKIAISSKLLSIARIVKPGRR